MTTLELKIDLPDQLANEIQAAGLLKPEILEQILRDAMRRKAINELFDAADKLANANLPTMTMEEIQEEVNAVRKQRQQRASNP